MTTRRIAAAVLAVACCACSSPPAQRPSCVATEIDGGVTVSCTDGTSITIRDGVAGGACALAILPDGRRRLECEDGTAIVLDGPAAPGSCRMGAGPDGDGGVRCEDGTAAPIGPGADAVPCAVEPGPSGARTVRCPDGTHAVVTDGTDGTACAVVDNGDGTRTVACEDGSVATVRAGVPGTVCTLEESPAGVRRVTCADGSSAVILGGAGGSGCVEEVAASGERTIRCDDGTSAAVGGGSDAQPCDVSCALDGSCIVSCPDGTTIAIAPGRGEAGVIRGSVVLFPGEPGAGATLRAEGTSVAAVADGSGSFELGPLPAGLHHLSIEAPGFAASRVPNIPILGGVTTLPPVTLRRGARIVAGEGFAPFQWSTDGARLLLWRGALGVDVFLHDVAGATTTLVASDIAALGTDPELTRALIVRGAELVHRDLGTGAERVLATGEDASTVWAAEDVRTVARLGSRQPARVGQFGELVIQSTEDGADLLRSGAVWPLAGHPPGGERFVFLENYDRWTDSGAPAVWDAAAGLVRRYAGPVKASQVRLSTSTRRALAFVRGSTGGSGGELAVVDLDSGVETVLGPVASFDGVLRSEDDGALAYRDEAGDVVHFDLSAATRSVAGRGFPYVFPGDGGLLLGFDAPSWTQGPMDVWVWDRSGVTSVIARGVSDFSAPRRAFSADGRYVALARNPVDVHYSGELLVHDRWTGSDQLPSPNAQLSRHAGFGPGGDLVFLEDFDGQTGRLVRFEPATGTRSEVAGSSADLAFWLVDGASRRRVVYAREPHLVSMVRGAVYWQLLAAEVHVVDPTSGSDGTVCAGCDIGFFGSDGDLRVAGDRIVAHDRPWAPGVAEPLVSFDVDTLTSTLIDEAADDVAVHPSGLIAYEVLDLSRPDRSGVYVARLP